MGAESDIVQETAPAEPAQAPAAAVAGPALTPALAARLDPLARAAAVRKLQRRAGNAAVRRLLLRQKLTLRTRREVGTATSAANSNHRRDVEDTLRRLLDLWSIEVAPFKAAMSAWAKYGPEDVIPDAELAPLTAAITKNETPSLANEVSNNFLWLNLPGGRGVGEASANDANDVKAVQQALILHGYLTGSASGTVDQATKDAIKKFKQDVASDNFKMAAMRPNERVNAHDKYAAGSFVVTGDTIKVTPGGKTESVDFPKPYFVFVPRSAPADRNLVHLFFTPYLRPDVFADEQGLRSEHDGRPWILIGVPGLPENAKPNWLTISTDEIKRCLSAVGRGTNIDGIRMSAHSRGHRALEHTLGFGGAPTIDLKLVERVTVFDASYGDLGKALRGAGIPVTGVNLYDVTVGNISGFAGKRFDSSAVRAIAFLRFTADAIARGDIVEADLSILDPATFAATKRLLAVLPPRGGFSTRSGKGTDLAGWIAANKADLKIVDDEKKGLGDFVFDNGLAIRMDRDLTAHHWLVAELAHEAVD